MLFYIIYLIKSPYQKYILVKSKAILNQNASVQELSQIVERDICIIKITQFF